MEFGFSFDSLARRCAGVFFGEIMDIKIPECEDIEWQQEMLRQLADRLSNLSNRPDGLEEMREAQIEEAKSIVDALQQYSGY